MMDTVEPVEGPSRFGRPTAQAGAQVVPRPALFERLGSSARVTVVAAPAGSGKTVLLRSWIAEAGLEEHVAWVQAGRDERDPQRFWLQVLGALNRTSPGAHTVRAVTAAPDLDGWTLVEHVLEDLAALEDRLWVVVDDVHELGSTEALRQLELLVMRAPPALSFVLATRHDVRLGLHRLRLEGELAEIRAADLRFSVTEAEKLLRGAGVELSGPALTELHRRTEGWAAGLRLAALSLAGHPDPTRFAMDFSGSERTVAEYLVAEVLERQSDEVRRLLLRTSLLERVNGDLADLLTGDEGGERVLQDLEEQNAFVIAVDPARTWFRYHRLFADLLMLELRRAAPGQITGLHRSAAAWLAGNGFPVEAVRQALAAQDYDLAAHLLADHWTGLYLDGQGGSVHGLLSGFPADLLSTDAELAVVTADAELAKGSFEMAERYLELADRGSPSVLPSRRGQLRLLRGVVSLLLAGQRGDPQTETEEAQRLQAIAEDPEVAQLTMGDDLRALALISLGSTEFWAAGEDARRFLESGLTLARRIGRPYLEFTGLAYQSAVEHYESFKRSAEHAEAAVELAWRHGWSNEPAFGVACTVLGAVLVWQGQLDEAEPWVQRAERALRTETHPAPALSIRALRGLLELARGHDAEALAGLEAAERMGGRLAVPHHTVPPTQALVVHTLVRLGETERAEQALAGLSQQDGEHAEIRIAAAGLRLAQGDPQAALGALAPVLDRPALVYWQVWLPHAFILEASARDALGDRAAADTALEHALDTAEPNGIVLPFFLHPVPDLLERHARCRTAHGAMVAEIQSLLSGAGPSSPAGPQPPVEPLSDSELRVLRYLPTNLTIPEIAREIYVSQNTVKTHVQNLYAKLGTHRRSEAVIRARDLGLLAPSRGWTKAAAPKP